MNKILTLSAAFALAATALAQDYESSPAAAYGASEAYSESEANTAAEASATEATLPAEQSNVAAPAPKYVIVQLPSSAPTQPVQPVQPMMQPMMQPPAPLIIPAAIEEPPVDRKHQHRNFYFGLDLGFAYASVEESYRENSLKTKETEFSAIAFPAFDFKIGGSFVNFAAAYFIYGYSRFSGEQMVSRYEYEHSTYSYSSDEIESAKLKKKLKLTNKTAYFTDHAIGAGLTIYPFRNPDFIMNGSFVGFAVLGNILNNDDFFDISGESLSSYLSMRFEIGKDWWINDTWSTGVSFKFDFGSFEREKDYDGEEESKGSFIRIQIALRIIHG